METKIVTNVTVDSAHSGVLPDVSCYSYSKLDDQVSSRASCLKKYAETQSIGYIMKEPSNSMGMPAELLRKRQKFRPQLIVEMTLHDSDDFLNTIINSRNIKTATPLDASKDKKRLSVGSKKSPRPAFNERFNYLGIHPNLITKDMVDKNVNVGPGKYNIKESRCTYTKPGSFYDWNLRFESEEWSKNLGYIFPWTLSSKQEYKKILGPGRYDVESVPLARKTVSHKADVHLGTVKRFKVSKIDLPPPGAYTKSIFAKPKKSTPVPTFEWDGCKDRFAYSGKTYHLAPNRYQTVIRDTIAERVSKSTSTRKHPLDFSTGPRDTTTIKNYFARPKSAAPDVFFVPRSDIDDMMHKNKKQLAALGKHVRGKMFREKSRPKGVRKRLLSFHKPSDPGPGHYDTEHPKKIKQCPNPFNQSSSRKLELEWKISPGPGRYRPRLSLSTKCPRKRMTCVFASKTERFVSDVVDYSGYFS